MSEKACAASMAKMVDKRDAALKWNIPMSQAGFGDLGAARGDLVDPAFTKLAQGFVGWGGWGGSISLWNPSHRISVSYTMNGMTNDLLGGPRSLGIFSALRSILQTLK